MTQSSAELSWLQLAAQPAVVKRGLKFGLGVGAILIFINHGDAVLAGELTPMLYFKMGLTVMVPYLVSTASSVGAQLEARRRGNKL
jgi:hypothetical protein